MKCFLKCPSMAVRWGLLGLVSGVLSCVISQSRIIVRDQRTLDHIIWPGMVFALVVLLPLSRWAADSWLRTAAVLIASSAVYPLTWRIATLGIRPSWGFMIGAFALGGFLGSFVLAGVFLTGRPRWVKAACMTVVLGTVIGALGGAHLGATMAGVHSPLTAGDGLGLLMVLWQAAMAASLGRGVRARSSPLAGVA
ncbi:MAG: hypothetical protein LLG20_27185 [Acidobacteriales bacterium]|nr:hypothetical protein [Terriglobales bacterium]